jgi:hypothetical protein
MVKVDKMKILILLVYIVITALMGTFIDWAIGYKAEGTPSSRIVHDVIAMVIGMGIYYIIAP